MLVVHRDVGCVLLMQIAIVSRLRLKVEVFIVDCFFFFQAEDGIRDLVRSRGLGDVYKRQGLCGLGDAGVYGDLGQRLSRRMVVPAHDGSHHGLSLIHI